MSLQERLETIRSSPVPPNEESAKNKIVTPILRLLGWDPTGPEVEYEYPVGGKGGGRVDIALRSPDRIVALIEAKTPGADLNSHVAQVLGYAFHEGVDICVLTTGLKWWLYLPRESGRPSERRFAVLKVADDPVEQLLEDFNAFLSKETLVNGQAERRAKAVRKAGLEAAQFEQGDPDHLEGNAGGTRRRTGRTPQQADLREGEPAAAQGTGSGDTARLTHTVRHHSDQT